LQAGPFDVREVAKMGKGTYSVRPSCCSRWRCTSDSLLAFSLHISLSHNQEMTRTWGLVKFCANFGLSVLRCVAGCLWWEKLCLLAVSVAICTKLCVATLIGQR